MAEIEGMTIGGPVSAEHIPGYGGSVSKYAELFAQVDRLEPGQWLPVTAENVRRRAGAD